ncbi:EamA family transporter [Kordiimonas sp. SCSIO 12603]|uniref:DMT family transporter n=1 Tax=Kordiimonas sp. SCSIO 12603 TaxID=2829596 RepID=UPI0021029712|nr:DMT family transporter [Kordiimonas sp. SCSIO 12603]UTW58214.1 EamA family transporter [Kordiimonas sp. SCSIO 12603]
MAASDFWADHFSTILILISALFHAGWSAAVKSTSDKFSITFMMCAGGGILCLPLTFFVPFPTSELWFWLIISLILHGGYQAVLLKTLEAGDLTHVYPIARGTGPLFVAFISFFLLAEKLTLPEYLAIAIIVGGIFLTGSFRFTPETRKATILALFTGIFIAGYSVIDAIGVKTANNPFSFIIWSNVIFAPVFIAAGLKSRGIRIFQDTLANWHIGVPVMIIAYTGYALALLAYRHGSIAEVAALRETSIIFATLIGLIILKESFSKRRTLAAIIIAFGAIILKIN